MEYLEGYSVLYAEDEALIRMGLTEKLKSHFKEVYVAKDGKEAIDAYHKQKPDVLLLDIQMPYKSGLDVAKEVREHDSNIPIVLLTAYTQKPYMEEALSLDIMTYLVKPILESELEVTLKKISQKLQ